VAAHGLEVPATVLCMFARTICIWLSRGVWDRSVGEDDDVIESCAVIRLPANDLMTNIANTEHRMRAILRRKDYQTWLRGTPVEAKATLQPYRASSMQAYAVSPRINSTAPDDPDFIRPVH
jgi:putative SOS response-associated peptidase YedK